MNGYPQREKDHEWNENRTHLVTTSWLQEDNNPAKHNVMRIELDTTRW